jgi:hypothetical protein
MESLMAKEELFTTGKLAEQFGTTVNNIKKVIVQLKIEPDSVKGKCNYYNPKTALKIKAGL